MMEERANDVLNLVLLIHVSTLPENNARRDLNGVLTEKEVKRERERERTSQEYLHLLLEKQSTEPESVVLNSYSTIKSSKDTSLLITSNMDSQNLAFCMQPADLTDIEMTRLWETNNASNSFQIKDSDDKNDFNFTVPGTNASIVNTPSYYQDPRYLVENTNTVSSSSSLKTLNYANTTHQNAAPHINSNDFLPLYDNALFALPKTENNVFISVTHPSPYDLNGIHDAFHYSELGFDMTHGLDVHLSNHTNQWLKSNMLDNQDYITGI